MNPRGISNHDLIIGLLALQNGLIDSSALVAAFHAWTRDKRRPIAEILVERGAIDAAERALLEGLASKHLERHGGDLDKSVAALGIGGMARDGLAKIEDPDIEASLARIGPVTSADAGVTERTATYDIGATTSGGQRFRVLRPHARGGLGAVFVALDAELHREVALKQILEGHADDPVSRQRFLLEAEITGGLEHPGIVPVYGLGTYSDGRPYYAMRFVRGDSLKEAIAHFHGDAAVKRDPGNRSLELHKLLRRFMDVCNAIDYAHGRGILHRDIKPGNIIVGRHGETLIIDWGLAKPMSRADSAAAAAERTLVPNSAGATADTLPGATMGTPSFMSPEQAAGDLGQLGPRSDVYSLGATLYCILTGNPPFEGGDVGSILRALQKGEFKHPRVVDPTIDRALEAVCLKAMALKPDDRYASCRALADDIERWMADEPVAACPDPLTKRVSRWMRRNKTPVAVAAALLITGTAGLAANNVLVNRQKARAEANFELARHAVDDMYTQVAERWLSQEPQMEPLQREFLLKALEFYERFAQPDAASPDVRREAGRAARRVGEIQQKLGEHAAAEESFRRSSELLESLSGDDRADQEFAVTQNRLGWFQWTLGQSPDAAFERALVLGTTLIRRPSVSPESRQELARAYSSQAIVHAAYGRMAEAEQAQRQAQSLRESLMREFPEVAVYRRDLAHTHANLVSLLRQTGRFDEAIAESTKAVELTTELFRSAPRDPNHRADLAHNLDERANLLGLLGNRREAEDLLQEGCEIADRLVIDFPRSLDYQDLQSSLRRDLGILRRDRGLPADAHPDLTWAIAVATELVQRNPAVPNYRRTLALHHSNFGDLLHTEGRPDEAEREYQAALELSKQLADEQPGVLDYRAIRTLYRMSLAFLLRATGRNVESVAAYDSAIAELEVMSREFPQMPSLRASLAAAYYQRGEALSVLHRPEADESQDRAIELAESLATQWPRIPSFRVTVAQALTGKAQLALRRHNTAEARQFHEHAIPHLEAALAVDSDSNGHHFLLMRVTSGLAQVQAQEGNCEAAEQTTHRLDELARTSIEYYNAACFLSLVIPPVLASREPDSQRNAIAQQLSDRAIAHLRRAIELGYRNAKLLESDPDLDPIRLRQEFQTLRNSIKQVENETNQ